MIGEEKPVLVLNVDRVYKALLPLQDSLAEPAVGTFEAEGDAAAVDEHLDAAGVLAAE